MGADDVAARLEPDLPPPRILPPGRVLRQEQRVEGGVREVQARLGHASPAAAYRYQHVLENRDAEIADRLDVVFRGKKAERTTQDAAAT